MFYTDPLNLDINSFISPEEAIAPRHPLYKHLSFPIPSLQHASPEQIKQVQLRDRIPGVVKRLIPFDAETSWEYWWVVPGRILLPEDVDLLDRDRDRLENILSQLLWLLGGYCFADRSPRDGELTPIHDWHQVVEQARQLGFNSYLLDIDYLPTAIKPYTPDLDTLNRSSCEYVAVEPAHWHIEFFEIQPTDGGFIIQEPKQLCSCQIWTGKPFLKHRQTGQTSIQYDLWVCKPLDITTPPWREHAEFVKQ